MFGWETDVEIFIFENLPTLKTIAASWATPAQLFVIKTDLTYMHRKCMLKHHNCMRGKYENNTEY